MSAREAYIAGSSGSKEYTVTKGTSPEDAQRQVAAFTAGSNTVQRDTPDIFKDQIKMSYEYHSFLTRQVEIQVLYITAIYICIFWVFFL